MGRRHLASVILVATITLLHVNLSFASASHRAPVPNSGPATDKRFAITDLQLVTGDNDQQALAKCGAQDGGATWTTAGIKWTTGNANNASTRLCAQRQSIDSLAGNNTTNQVLTRILVLASATECPSNMKRLTTNALIFQATLTTETQVPAIVCLRFENAPDAIARHNYISDIMVTQERNYNNMYSGWTTIPINVQIRSSETTGDADPQPVGITSQPDEEKAHAETAKDSTHPILRARHSLIKTSDTAGESDPLMAGNDVSRRMAERDENPFVLQGAFISYKRPVLPIVDFKVLEAATTQNAYQCCGELPASGSSFWEQAGDGFVDTKDSVQVLCLQRDYTMESTSSVLTEVDLVTTDACKAGFDKRAQLSADSHLCGKFATSSPTTKPMFVGDLALVRTRLTSFNERIVPGSWRGMKGDLNRRARDVSTFLLYRVTDDLQFDPPTLLQKSPLVARRNGDSLSFKILQLSDLHITGDPNFACRDPPKGMAQGTCVEALTSKFMNSLLDVEKPDMVVYTGDNIETFNPELREVAFNTAVQAVEERQIPWAMVLGNHDDENGFDREQILSMALAKKHSYTQRGPKQVPGVGNYELNVFAPHVDANSTDSDGKSAVFRMYFLDSHGYPNKQQHPDTKSTYDWVKPSQIEFYRALSRSHVDDRVPSLMFFHIPIPEFEMLSNDALSGEKNEGVSSSSVNTNLFSTLVEQNEVKAVFVGHDHVNEYCMRRQDIQLCYGGGPGFGRAYGRESVARRARVIEWTKDLASGARTIKSWKRSYDSIDQTKSEETLFQG